ncbi:MAG: serine acetyltransferase, partial [Halobacteriales archaeon SW_8_66_22]
MGYEYTGDAHRELVESYRTDESPFPTDSSREYPRRDSLRDELPLLKQLLFPNCWNATELLDDPDETRARLTELGVPIYKGITAYSD